MIVAGLLAGALAAGLALPARQLARPAIEQVVDVQRLGGRQHARIALRLVGAFAFAPTPPAAVSACRDGGTSGAYALLEAHRPDVLIFYAAQGWHPLRQCRQNFDDWLAHGPDGAAVSAEEYVRRRGWRALPAAAGHGH